MLLVSIPKSASTSLKYSIAENGFINTYPKNRKEFYNVNDEKFPELQKTCTTIYDFDSIELWKWLSNRNYIIKKHILPTKRNFKTIDALQVPFVVLLREPIDVLDAFERNKKQHKLIYKWDYDLNKIKYELLEFVSEWEEFAQNKDYILIIYYKDLILNYQNTMNRIFKFFNLRRRMNYLPLQKKVFTGVGLKRLHVSQFIQGQKCK